MAFHASKDALSKSGINKEDIGAIFLATCTPEKEISKYCCSSSEQIRY